MITHRASAPCRHAPTDSSPLFRTLVLCRNRRNRRIRALRRQRRTPSRHLVVSARRSSPITHRPMRVAPLRVYAPVPLPLFLAAPAADMCPLALELLLEAAVGALKGRDLERLRSRHLRAPLKGPCVRVCVRGRALVPFAARRACMCVRA